MQSRLESGECTKKSIKGYHAGAEGNKRFKGSPGAQTGHGKEDTRVRGHPVRGISNGVSGGLER